MKNAELWESYQEYTRILSETTRQLGFAAAAICWFFKTPEHAFPQRIVAGLGLVVIFFIADILQYLFGALMLKFWTRAQEKKKWKQTGKIEGDYDKPAWLDCPSFFMWWVKVLSLLAAFVFIGLQLMGQ